MAYKDRKSPALILKSESRLAGVLEVDTKKGTQINYGKEGETLTSKEFTVQIEACNRANLAYNQILKTADDHLNGLLAEEKKLAEMYTQILNSAKGKFGTDATEIEMLGGTRKSERKKPSPKPAQ